MNCISQGSTETKLTGYIIYVLYAKSLQSCLTLWDPVDRSMPGFPVLPEFAQTCVNWVSDATQPSCPLLPSSSPALNLFQHEGLRIRWPKYWSFSVCPSNEYSRLIFFRIAWFDLLAVHETLKSLLQHHSFKASICQRSAFFMVQLSHPYRTTGKAVTDFVSKVMSLIFNMLSRFVIAFLPRSKHLLISCLQSPSAVIFEHKEIKDIGKEGRELHWEIK